MSRLADPPPAPSAAVVTPSVEAKGDPRDPHEATNFIWLALHQVLLRLGWIFKTESIVMPAFMSLIGGGPVMLGLLPVLSRLGFSVPPLLYTTRLKLTPKKKWSVVATTTAMAAPFAVLSAVWFTGVWRAADGSTAAWMPIVFLVAYTVFFTLTGLNQLGVNALQGKLIRADLRGRLFTGSVVVGAPLAIAAAAWLLPAWLAQPDGGFGWVFGAVAVAFVLAGLSLLPSVEQADNFTEQSTNPWQKFHAAWRLVSDHADARAVGILAALGSVNLMLFPHYQAIGRDQFGLQIGAMTLWVCVQNAATAVIGLVVGPLADRCGNRLALNFLAFGLAAAPLMVLVFLAAPTDVGAEWFWIVFVPLGFTPVVIRMLMNYTLEIATAEDHPKFVSAIGMCLAVPVIVGSPIVGMLIGVVGTGPVFAGGLVLLLAAGAQTFRLAEPRHRR